MSKGFSFASFTCFDTAQSVQVIGLRYREDLYLDAPAALEDRLGIITPIDPRYRLPHRDARSASEDGQQRKRERRALAEERLPAALRRANCTPAPARRTDCRGVVDRLESVGV